MTVGQSRITPVILSGGSGTRLWPHSRPERPKQLLALTADATMLQLTVQRTADTGLFAPPIIVANAAHADLIEQQIAEAGHHAAALILEPVARNTAPAIALAAHAMASPSALMLVMPSDHVIADEPAFLDAVRAALPIAEQRWLVTFGITPDGPETGYGYIAMGEEITAGIRRVDRFIEKPDRAHAEAMLNAGGHAWNGGIFLFRADAYLDCLQVFAPAMHAAVQSAMGLAQHRGTHILPDGAAFAASPGDSIDYAVMEKAEKVAVVPVAMGWSDVGSWDALHAISAQDCDGNVLTGDVLALETSRCLVRSDGPRIAMVGVTDLIVVASGGDILILPRGKSQMVKAAQQARMRDQDS